MSLPPLTTRALLSLICPSHSLLRSDLCIFLLPQGTEHPWDVSGPGGALSLLNLAAPALLTHFPLDLRPSTSSLRLSSSSYDHDSSCSPKPTSHPDPPSLGYNPVPSFLCLASVSLPRLYWVHRLAPESDTSVCDFPHSLLYAQFLEQCLEYSKCFNKRLLNG